MGAQTPDLWPLLPRELLEEVRIQALTRTVAPFVSGQDGRSQCGRRQRGQIVREISVKPLRILCNGRRTINQRLVQVEENRVRHHVFLRCSCGIDYWINNLDI